MKVTRITKIHPSHPRFRQWKRDLNNQGYIVILMYDQNGFSYRIVKKGPL